MPSYNSLISNLAGMGLGKDVLDKALGDDPYVRLAVVQMTERVRDTWQQIWDEAEAAPGSAVQPKFPGSHPYATGQYRGSLVVEYKVTATGYFEGCVRTRDRKAFHLEYGTKVDTKQGSKFGPFTPTAEYAPARRTIDRLGGRRGSGDPAPNQPTGRNWAGSV
jgi:hypothetical protein